MFSMIRKSSTELNDEVELRWHFPSALSPEAHAEWGLYNILEYTGLHVNLPPGEGQNRNKLKKEIKEYYLAYNIDFEEGDLETFISRRPDGLAFDRGKKSCVFLEYTRAMDIKEDWTTKKEQEEDDRYSSQLGFNRFEPPLQAREERLESHTNQLPNVSMRLPTYQSIYN